MNNVKWSYGIFLTTGNHAVFFYKLILFWSQERGKNKWNQFRTFSECHFTVIKMNELFFSNAHFNSMFNPLSTFAIYTSSPTSILQVFNIIELLFNNGETLFVYCKKITYVNSLNFILFAWKFRHFLLDYYKQGNGNFSTHAIRSRRSYVIFLSIHVR